jgi:hypothetical protein
VIGRHVARQLNLLIDGRLDRDDALKAMAHLEECERCGARWEALRRGREALQTSGSGIDMRSAQHLLNRDRIAMLAKAEPRRHIKVAAGVRPRFFKGLILTAPMVVATLTALYMLGEPREIPLSTLLPGNTVYGPTVSSLALDGSTSVGSVEYSSCPQWVDPDMTPLDSVVREEEGVKISETRVLFEGNQLTVTERPGRLPREVGEVLPRAESDRDVYVLDEEGTDIVFESAGQVVTASCDCPTDVLVGFAGGFPEGDSPGLLTQLGDGVGVVVDAVTGD